MAVIIELSEESIVDESVARAVVELLDAVVGLEPQRYDLNQRGNWRGWDVDRAAVDLVTQRTQLFRVEGKGGTAMVATGKHGAPPTIAIDGLVDDDFDVALVEPLRPRDVRIVRTG